MNDYVLAADMGGTNLRMAAIGVDGEFIDSRSIATPSSSDLDAIVDGIVSIAEQCRDNVPDRFKLRSLGLAVAALVSADTGHIVSSPNLPQLTGCDLAGMLRERLGIPVVLENDANAAAVAEQWPGAAEGARNAIVVTLGTGMGGGLILNGKIFRGSGGTAGEIGHINVEPDGIACGCGSVGCVEQYASATGIVRMARELDLSVESALDVYNAAAAGDAAAADVFRRMGGYLGTALAGLINVLNPDVIVIGGRVAAGWDAYIQHVRSRIAERAFRGPAQQAKLVRAKIGDQAGILGAARLASNMEPLNTLRAK